MYDYLTEEDLFDLTEFAGEQTAELLDLQEAELAGMEIIDSAELADLETLLAQNGLSDLDALLEEEGLLDMAS